MKRRVWLAGTGVTMFLVSCSNSPTNQQTQAPTNQTSPAPAAVVNAGTPQTFPNPVVSPATTVQVSALPGLIQPTNTQVRVPTIPAGRPDPFALLETPPLKLTKASTSTSVEPATRPISVLPANLPPISLSPLPTIPVQSSAALPQFPADRTAPPPIKPFSPTALADAIEITGAIQVGNKWNVIVKEPDATSSRYAAVGDYLVNGQVQIKRVIAGSGSHPVVVLQQNGREVMKPVGGSKVSERPSVTDRLG